MSNAPAPIQVKLHLQKGDARTTRMATKTAEPTIRILVNVLGRSLVPLRCNSDRLADRVKPVDAILCAYDGLLDQQVKHEDCWRVVDSIQAQLPDMEARQLVLGRTFCQLPNGYAVVSPTRSLLMTFDLNWTLTGKVFVADDTLLSPDDTLIRLLPPQRYHSPDHIYPLPSATGKQVELGLLAGARLAIVNLETKRLRMYGFSTEWPGEGVCDSD